MSSPDQDPIAAACLQTLESVLEPRSAIYVCGALETGLSYYERMAAGVTVNMARVRAENQACLTEFARELRASSTMPVIDPGVLRVGSWSRDMYGPFFLQVIDRFAAEAWFTTGWEYSRGASSEYVHCVSSGIPCRDTAGAELPVDAATELLRGAAARMTELELDPAKFESRIMHLTKMTSNA
jgi:hypothetical protein